jgi:hypothetical protein
MKSRKIRLVSFYVFIFLVFATNIGFTSAKNNNVINLSISLEKNTFLIREPIWLEITAVNLSDTDIVIFPLVPECISCIRIILKNSQEKPLQYEGMIYDYVSGYPRGALVKPNEVYKNEPKYNLLDGFGERVNNWPLRRFLKPGTYTVQVLYLERVSSNILEFEVKTPQGDEEKAFKLLAEGISYLFKDQRDELVRKLEELVAKYPKSAYADLAYYEMTYWDKNKERAKKSARELILKYPDSKFTRNAFWKLLRGEKRENKKKILKEWISKLPGTKAEEYAKQTLEALESKKD